MRKSAAMVSNFFVAPRVRNNGRLSASAPTSTTASRSISDTAWRPTVSRFESDFSVQQKRMERPQQRASSSTSSSSAFKPWPSAMVESHGDYRDEQWIEQHVGGNLYSIQNNNTTTTTTKNNANESTTPSSLPRLPVCLITQTLDRFLPTALPLAHTPTEAAFLQRAVSNFPTQAAVYQTRLQERAADPQTSSWLQHWWNTWCYLQARDSVVINVSYFFHFADDPSIHHHPHGRASSTTTTTTTTTTANKNTNSNCPPPMIARAATLLTATAEFRRLVGTGDLPVDRIGKNNGGTPLCATPYKYMFHACRIPQNQQDSVRLYDPAVHHHAIVAVHGHFFAVDLVDPTTHQPYPVSDLEVALLDCIHQATTASAVYSKNNPSLGLGWCTSSNRDDWSVARTLLLQAGGAEMARALTLLESGAVLLCLDGNETAVSSTEMAQLLLHGSCSVCTKNSTTASGGNRWFDKSVQLIVSANGKAGLTGEHSMMDGMPMVRFADHLTKATYTGVMANQTTDQRQTMNRIPTVRPVFSSALCETIRATAVPLVEKAKHDFHQLVSNNSLHVQSFHGYGSTFMKKAGYSPDAYVQLAMQLATYRLWGEQAGTYEATQVRPFLHGRTETTRTVSTESAAFVQKLGLQPALDEHDDASRRAKLHLLQQAVLAHVRYTGAAAQAQGVDRHFLGLSMLVQNGEAMPDLYADPVFHRAKRWRVSTSHLTHPRLENWGYGQVVPDGVGLAYSIHPRHCVFNITALKETKWTDKLSQLIEEALLEMRVLVETQQLQESGALRSKL